MNKHTKATERSILAEQLMDALLKAMADKLKDNPTAADINNVIRFLDANGYRIEQIEDEADLGDVLGDVLDDFEEQRPGLLSGHTN